MRQGAGTTLRKEMGMEKGRGFRIRDTYTSMGIHPWYILADHLTCCLRNLYAGQEGTVTTEHEITGSK